jgi:hypothetical protein
VDDCLLQAVLRAFSMLLAWAPTRQEDVASALKHRFASWSHAFNNALFFDERLSASASDTDAKSRNRFVHKLLLNLARDQACQLRPSLKKLL